MTTINTHVGGGVELESAPPPSYTHVSQMVSGACWLHVGAIFKEIDGSRSTFGTMSCIDGRARVLYTGLIVIFHERVSLLDDKHLLVGRSTVYRMRSIFGTSIVHLLGDIGKPGIQYIEHACIYSTHPLPRSIFGTNPVHLLQHQYFTIL
jgi:hypothetical protein